MFRKSSGGLGFSWRRFITNAQPNFANDSRDDVDLSPKQQDDLFRWQIGLEDPKTFDDLSFFIAGVVVLKSLRKIGIVSPVDGSIHTELITRKFPNQVPKISIHRQRKLIGLLFFWEEELVRWRLLDDEAEEIRAAMKVHGEDHEMLKIALGTVWAKRTMAPSARIPEAQGAHVQHKLPSYGDRRHSVRIMRGAGFD